MNKTDLIQSLYRQITFVISETNGLSMGDTLELLIHDEKAWQNRQVLESIIDFKSLIDRFSLNKATIHEILTHPVSLAFEQYFKSFPIKYHEEHIHLTGSLKADFIYPRIKKLCEGPKGEIYQKKIAEVYGPQAWPITSEQDVDNLIRLKENQGFKEYLKILYLAKLILVDRQAHKDSAYHLAKSLYFEQNVGSIRLKFSISRSAGNSTGEQIPGADDVETEDIVLGLYEGFKKFQDENPDFDFILSPSFRKEADFFDSKKFKTRQEHFESLVDKIVDLVSDHPFLKKHLVEVDTVGNETGLYRKEHFYEFTRGLRKLQYRGFKIRSHHGETFLTLKKGIQSVDNAMNIWHIDTLEHGLALGINPNYYFHRLYQRVIQKNQQGQALLSEDKDYQEVVELDWRAENKSVFEKVIKGLALNENEKTIFLKTKFHTAREVEHYQHDVLNRMIQKGVSLIGLPSSNNKLTGQVDDYKDHPFSWWEKKGVTLGLGTDNYVTLNTSYIQEMLIVLYSDHLDLKITKLLMVTTKESRRPYMSQLLWQMRKNCLGEK